ncbi:MAG: M48 family metallopeptidase [Patescibacteria group bacterium]
MYSLKRNRRTRGISISIRPGGEVTVTAHPLIPKYAIEAFVSTKKDWIEKHSAVQKEKSPKLSKSEERKEYLQHKAAALALAHARLEHFNRVYGFKYQSVAIKNTSSRWGSCSRRGNLNFSYKIALIPQVQSDYIIVHELCHLRQFNHSQRFWDLVAITYPDHKKIRKFLRDTSLQ